MAGIERCHNIDDLRAAARRRLPKWIFEFVDRGSEDEWAIANNREAFRRVKLLNRALVDMSGHDLGATLLGGKISLPVAIAPTGAAGLCCHEGELALAKAAAKAGVPYTLAVSSLAPLEKIAAEAGGRLWFQTYLWEDRQHTENLVRRVDSAGYELLMATVDVGIGTNREFNYRNGYSNPFRPSYPTIRDVLLRPRWMADVLFKYLMTGGMPKLANIPPDYTQAAGAEIGGQSGRATWEHFKRLRDLWPRKLVIKGIVRPDDAVRAVECGADGIVVSNHGGRNMDSAVASLDALPDIVKAVGDRTTVMLDSGIRRGSDMVKAYALGAKAVLLGRATLFGVAVAGQAGAARALDLLRREYELTLAFVGARGIEELGQDVLATGRPLCEHDL